MVVSDILANDININDNGYVFVNLIDECRFETAWKIKELLEGEIHEADGIKLMALPREEGEDLSFE